MAKLFLFFLCVLWTRISSVRLESECSSIQGRRHKFWKATLHATTVPSLPRTPPSYLGLGKTAFLLVLPMTAALR
jgi:hypothetical protein